MNAVVAVWYIYFKKKTRRYGNNDIRVKTLRIMRTSMTSDLKGIKMSTQQIHGFGKKIGLVENWGWKQLQSKRMLHENCYFAESELKRQEFSV